MFFNCPALARGKTWKIFYDKGSPSLKKPSTSTVSPTCGRHSHVVFAVGPRLTYAVNILHMHCQLRPQRDVKLFLSLRREVPECSRWGAWSGRKDGIDDNTDKSDGPGPGGNSQGGVMTSVSRVRLVV